MKTIDNIDKKYFLMADTAIKKAIIKPSDITICCPICKEGGSWNKKQRCHLYIKSTYDKPMVHCYNCDYHYGLESFLDLINKDLVQRYKTEKFSEIKNIFQKGKPKEIKKVSEKTIKIDEPYTKYKLDDFKFLKKSLKVKEYLKSRNLSEFSELFLYADKNIEINNKFLPISDSIITPLFCKDERYVYGFQARKLSEKRFYNFIPDENSGFKIWNLNNVKKDEPLFIFESVFDALSSGLKIGNISAILGSDLDLKRFNFKYPIYALDNQWVDNTSMKKTKKLLQTDYCVVWDKKFKVKDYNELLKLINKDSVRKLLISGVEKGLSGIVKLSL